MTEGNATVTVQLAPALMLDCKLTATYKYTVVRTKNEEFLIRKTIRDLLDELSPDQFWQIHRATLVNVGKIQMAARSLTGSYHIHLTDLQETLPVSRSFSHLFKQM